jgi:hypothetical protein
MFASVAVLGASQVLAEPMQMDYYPQADYNSPRAQSQRAATAGGRGMDSRAEGNVSEEMKAVVGGTRARGAVATGSRAGNATQGRTAVRTNQVMTAGGQPTSAAPRGVAARGTTGATSRAQSAASGRAGQASPNAATPRAVQARSATTATRGGATTQRAVVSRSGTTARASLTGSPIAASTTANMARSGTALYGNVMYNLVDDTTGGLSTAAHQECLDAYYSCMDEICAARSPGMRRCACSNRVNAYTALEEQLATSRETILRLSSQLQMLEATRGGDISAAFQLTEAELSLNCVSFRDAYQRENYQKIKGAMEEWCENHNFGNSSTTIGGYSMAQCKTLGSEGPAYCVNLLGQRGAASLDGGDSDIMSQLQKIASSVNNTDWLIQNTDQDWFGNLYSNNAIYNNAFNVMTENCEEGFKNENGTCRPMTDVLDLWGEQLFNFAHNSVCKRVLDNCFNGICGWKASVNDATQGLILPTNPGNNDIDQDCWDKQIRLSTSVVGRGGIVNQQAMGYSKANDQFFGLRAPITQARFSIKQKYHFDANADCDVFGEELKTQTRNMSLQMVAAEEMLKRKRLEYAEEKVSRESTELASAQKNFINCLDEINQCQTHYKNLNPESTLMYIRGKCNAMVEIPSCYRQMVCDAGATRVVEKDAVNKDTGVLEQPKNAVTLMEILYGFEDATHKAELCITAQPMVNTIRCLQKSTGSVGATTCQ